VHAAARSTHGGRLGQAALKDGAGQANEVLRPARVTRQGPCDLSARPRRFSATSARPGCLMRPGRASRCGASEVKSGTLMDAPKRPSASELSRNRPRTWRGQTRVSRASRALVRAAVRIPRSVAQKACLFWSGFSGRASVLINSASSSRGRSVATRHTRAFSAIH